MIRFAWITAAVLVLASCSPDLHEATGPLVPFPNVEGTVERDGAPAAGCRVKLVITPTDSTWLKEHTDSAGRYGFAEVGIGEWTIKVSSTDTTEFASVAYEFVFSRPDTSTTVPPMDLRLRGAALVYPPPNDSITVPSFFQPDTFSWRPWQGSGTAQVRVQDDAGQPIWYSGKTTRTSVTWNGLANQGPGAGRPVTAGAYTWKVRFEEDGTAVEYTTATRAVIFLEPGP